MALSFLHMSSIAHRPVTVTKNVAVQCPVSVQVAAFCHRAGLHGREVLLVTSSSGRWILPKGWTETEMTDSDAAAQEAWEEAGVIAKTINDTPIGDYYATKTLTNGASVYCYVKIFEIEVQNLAYSFPEAHKRNRKWVPIDQVASAVADPGLAHALADYTARISAN